MEFFHRSSDNDALDTPVRAEDQPANGAGSEVPKPAPNEDSQPVERETVVDRDWQMIGLQALGALIVILIIIFGGRWLHHELTHNNGVKPAPANTKQLPPVPNGTTNSKAKSSSGKSGASSSANSTNSSPAATAGTNSSSNLPNTGPGNDLALFLVVAFAAASLHYLAKSSNARISSKK